MSDLRELYQEVIFDHNRHPRNFGKLAGANRHADGYNPLCGDKLSLYLKIEGDIITDVRFEGVGCAISTASASLMTERLKGMKVADAEALFHKFHAVVTEDATDGSGPDLGKLSVLTGVRDYPARVKCATLAWHTLEAALHNKETASTE
ncbi:MAG: SUF system NifU family Fe-S cluster assembly protein [Gammaproteobacteria bacterium]